MNISNIPIGNLNPAVYNPRKISKGEMDIEN